MLPAVLLSLLGSASALNFVDWKTYKPFGANLGSWLEKEATHDPVWWQSVGGAEAPDEWTLCETLGDKCGSVFEERYASFLNKSTIDKLASVGVDLLRIPTTYAAWIEVPGSALYHGNQQSYLTEIVNYAIDTYDMHIILGLHSLPGGVNNLDIGEALFHSGWFYNETNLAYSYAAVDAILDYIVANGRIDHFTVAPLNEASDNLTEFGSTFGLSQKASEYVAEYFHGVLDRIRKVDERIPMMVQDSFKTQEFWVPYFNATDNILIDVHDYFFAVEGKYAEYVFYDVCGQAQWTAEETTFPVFVGEWALQVKYNNTIAGRADVFNVQRYAWNKYTAGAAFWTAVSYANSAVSGEGVQSDYWSFVNLIDDGVTSSFDASVDYCALLANKTATTSVGQTETSTGVTVGTETVIGTETAAGIETSSVCASGSSTSKTSSVVYSMGGNLATSDGSRINASFLLAMAIFTLLV